MGGDGGKERLAGTFANRWSKVDTQLCQVKEQTDPEGVVQRQTTLSAGKRPLLLDAVFKVTFDLLTILK